MNGTDIDAGGGPPVRRRAGLADRIGKVVDRYGAVPHAAAILVLLALFVIAARFLTLEADEAWILLSATKAFGVAVPPTSALANPTVSTGGIYLLVQGLLALATPSLPVHRAVSVIAAAGLLLLVYRALRRLGQPSARASAGTALMAAIPGFVLQAGLATGELLAVLFLVAALLHWASTGCRSSGGAIVTGLLLGLACATRINCAAAAAGLLAYALAAPRPSLRRFLHAVLAVAVAAAVAGAMMALYYHLSDGSDAGNQAAYLSASTGVGTARKSIFQLMQNIDIVGRYLPPLLLAGIVGAWLVLRLNPGKADQAAPAATGPTDGAGVLLFAGLAMLGAWVLVAPIPHLRYLWPALACLWLAGTIVLLEACRGRGPVAALVLHAGVLATAGAACLSTALLVANGETLVLVYQTIGYVPRTPLDRAHRFAAAKNQAALSTFMAAQPASTRFFALTEPAGYPLSYLSRRQVHPVTAMAPATSDGSARLLILQPADAAIWRPGAAFDRWRRAHTRLVFRSGDMAAFEIAPEAPPPPFDTHVIGENDLLTG